MSAARNYINNTSLANLITIVNDEKESKIIEDYTKLKDKCDKVINKIRTRKIKSLPPSQ